MLPEAFDSEPAESLPHPALDPAPAAGEPRIVRLLRTAVRSFSLPKTILFGVSLALFILAMMLMKEGVSGLAPWLNGRFPLQTPANSLGFGWLFAYVLMSGSPVAASALTFLNAGLLNQMAAFTMISGSRLGSSLIVLIIGFLYVLRGRNRATSLSVGLLSFAVTGSLHMAILPLGALLLYSGVLQRINIRAGLLLNDVITAVFDPIIAAVKMWLPHWGLFLAGLAVILLSFSLFDKCLPQVTLKESRYGAVSRVVYRPLVMFLLGAAVTLLSMSVSVSLSILVPLSQRGFVRRENIIPYIMGANVTTFIDTLFAAVLLNNAAAVSVVLAQMVGVVLISALLLLTVFRRYERILLHFTDSITATNRNLAWFMLVIFILPVLLVLF